MPLEILFCLPRLMIVAPIFQRGMESNRVSGAQSGGVMPAGNFVHPRGFSRGTESNNINMKINIVDHCWVNKQEEKRRTSVTKQPR